MTVVTNYSLFFASIPQPPRSTLFPYTTLFRSLRRNEEAGAGRGARACEPGLDAVRQPPLARGAADELAHDLRAHRLPARSPAAQERGSARALASEGTHRARGRAREARGQPGRGRRPQAAARRRVRDRPEEGAARRA